MIVNGEKKAIKKVVAKEPITKYRDDVQHTKQPGGHYDRRAGISFIKTLRAEMEKERKPLIRKPKVVGGFTWTHPGGFVDQFVWIVSPRRDMRHGATHIGPSTAYARSLFEEMFRKW